MDATGSSAGGRSSAARSNPSPRDLEFDEDEAVLDDAALWDLIVRGQALVFLPGPVFDGGVTVPTGS